MKIALKNFIMTLRRYKIASLLNIAGLALALVAFYIIMVQVHYSMTFNGSIKDCERVYMISPYSELFGGWQESIPNPICYETAEELPSVESIASMTGYVTHGSVWIKKEGGNKERVACNIVDCNTTILDVFSFDIIAGNKEDFKQENAVVVSESAANSMGITVGSIVNLVDDNLNPGTPLTVAAIFKDFGKNTILSDKQMFRNDNRKNGMDNQNWNYSVFVKLKEGANPDDYIALWNKKFREYGEQRYAEYVAATGQEMSNEEIEKVLNMPIKLIPMDEFYFNTEFEDYPSGSKETNITLLAIAFVIITVAFINFINFFTALIPIRMRSVNICKVFGADRWTLRLNFLFEAVGLVIIALLTALCIVHAIDGGFINEYVECSIAVADNVTIIGIVLAISVAMALVAALYPAFYITRFNASFAVKSGFASSKAGRALRIGLVSLQFIASIALMIIALVFSFQYNYMARYDIGLERENLLAVEIPDMAYKSEIFIEELEKNPEIANVTSATNNLFGHSHTEQSRTINGKTIEMNIWGVRHNTPETLGIPIIAGEGFAEGRAGFLITDYTSEVTGLGIGDKWDNIDIVGIIPHINFMGANSPKLNTMLFSAGTDYAHGIFYIRLNKGVDIGSVSNDIKAAAKKVEPNATDPKIEFANDAITKIYGDTEKQTVIIALFALIAVTISLMGIFGIVLFETQHRRSEIAIRKVYGATSGSIVAMFNRRYLLIVAVCFAIAAPVAWIIASDWLQGFVNRIELSLWLPLAVLVIVALLTALLVTLRSWRAATENPADVVKSN